MQQTQCERRVYTVNQFCEAYGLSRATFYKLIKHGLGPRLVKIGYRTLVSAEAADEWLKRFEGGTVGPPPKGAPKPRPSASL